MMTALLLSALMLAHGAQVDPLHGSWQQTDVRSLEGGRQSETGAACLRIWLERRSYELEATGSRAQGVYANSLMAMPLGLLSNDPGCRFAAPATEPLTFHRRTWSVQAERVDATTWEVRAENGTNFGPLDLETPSFSTTLRLDGNRLVDLRDAEESLLFSRPADHQEARAVLERGIEQLHTGHCQAVYRRLELAPGAEAKIDHICDLMQRSRQFTGRFQAIEIDGSESFDAVPRGFPDPSSTTWVDRPGVLFHYKLVFEHQDLFGSAIVWSKEGAWRLAYVW